MEDKNLDIKNAFEVKQSNIKKVNDELGKKILATESNQLGTIFIAHLKFEDKQHINMILNLFSKLIDSSISNNEKDAVYYTLAGNSELIGLFYNKKFISDYVIYLNNSLRLDKEFENNLRNSGFNTLVNLVSKRSVDDVVNILLNTVSYCSLPSLKIPSSLQEVNFAIAKLKAFSLNKQDMNVKRPNIQKIEYKAIYKDIRTEEEKAADRKAAEFAIEEHKKEVERLGGEDNYNKRLRKAAYESKIINITKITDSDIDEVEPCQDKEDYFDIKPNISDVLRDILSIYSASFDLSITMRKFVGVYIFDDNKESANSSMAEMKVMEVVKTDDTGEVRLVTKEHNSKVLEWIQHSYDYPIKDSLKVARHNQVPSLENILINGYNYYPTFIARYALGFVKKEKYTNFNKFMKAVESDVEDRLYKIYKSEVEYNGTIFRGKDLFRAHNVDRLKLIGAFVNSIIFITGRGSENFYNTQFRCISAYSHTKPIDYYTDFKSFDDGTHKGLSEAAQAHFIKANGEFSTNILDITYLSDKEKFYKEVSWAYKELGVVYGEGDIPSVLDDKEGSGVVIGKTLAGELVKFNLGSNAAFVTSIYAGSRSGKGVTTLSILAAIMASGIGICYLDCKPDMANCFWDIEDRAAKRGRIGATDHVYSYDVNADKLRYNKYSPMKSLMKQCPNLRNSNMASALFILKNIQLITLTGQYKQRAGDSSTMVWVIDEVNNMINKLNSGYTEFERLAPKENAKEVSETQRYIKAVMNFWRNLQVTAASGVNDIYGQCGYKYIIIGQNPGDVYTGSKPTGKLTSGADILRILGTAPVNKYIYGRGLKEIQAVGSKAFHKDRSSEEISALEENKYFVIRRTAQQNAADGSKDDILFQPFLTLNYDDVLASCWTGGLGRKYGYDSNIKENDAGYASMIKNYKTCINADLGQPVRNDVLESVDSGYGVVDEGTGFFGLVKTYYSKYGKEAENKSYDVALKPYKELTSILTKMQLIGENSLFGYMCIEDFLYDFSPEAMQMTNYAELEILLENSKSDSLDNDVDEDNSNFDFNIDYNDEEENPPLLVESKEDYTDMNNSLEDNIDEDFKEEVKPFVEDDTSKLLNQKESRNFDREDEPFVDNNNNILPFSEEVKPFIEDNKDSKEKKPEIKKIDSAVWLSYSEDKNCSYVDENGLIHSKDCMYVTLIKNALPDLNDELKVYSSIPFIDRALVKRNIRNRYKVFINAVKEEIGWMSVSSLSMTEKSIVINGTNSMDALDLGKHGYNIYDVLDFEDLFFRRAVRLHKLSVDEGVSSRIISECGGDIYELLFNRILTLKSIQIGRTVISRNKREITMQMALKAEVATNLAKGKLKDSFMENLFASGEVKKTSENIAIAKRICRRAAKSNRKVKSPGLKFAMKIGQMTPFEALTGLISFSLLSINSMIDKAVKG